MDHGKSDLWTSSQTRRKVLLPYFAPVEPCSHTLSLFPLPYLFGGSCVGDVHKSIGVCWKVEGSLQEKAVMTRLQISHHHPVPCPHHHMPHHTTTLYPVPITICPHHTTTLYPVPITICPQSHHQHTITCGTNSTAAICTQQTDQNRSHK